MKLVTGERNPSLVGSLVSPVLGRQRQWTPSLTTDLQARKRVCLKKCKALKGHKGPLTSTHTNTSAR